MRRESSKATLSPANYLPAVTTAVLFMHLIGALLFVAGVVLAAAGFEHARRRERPSEVALLLRLARSGVLLVLIGGALLLVCGLGLVSLEHIGYDTGWVDLAIALFALTVTLGALGGRRPKEARKLATRLADEGIAKSPELHVLLDDPLSRLANYSSLCLVVAIVALMVFKP